MADRGHELTDELLSKLEKDIAREYRQANRDVAAKLKAYLEETEAKRKVQEELLKAGKITQKEFQDWCFRHTMMGKRWEEMRDVLAEDYHNANKIALQMSKDRMPDVYALNGNFATYQIEHDGEIDTGFTLYNHDTAEYLLEEERTLMPGPSTRKQREIAANKDMQWNTQKIQSTVLQGVLQGESPYEVAKRLMHVGQMNYNSAVRYARTMTTNAQNAGRYQAFERAAKVGVNLTIEWQATLDNRTRHEHRMMHGQRREVGEPFEIDGVKILWPAQVNYDGTNLPQELIWNCRCTLLSWVKGFEGDTVKSSPKMGDMSFEEWQNAKAMSQEEEQAWLKAGKPNLDDWRNDPSRKAVVNRASDTEQFARYKSVLGDNMPNDVDSFQSLKYNDGEKWEELKREYRSTSGSRQSREKAEKIASLPDATANPVENPEVVSWVKPIVGNHNIEDDIKATNPHFYDGREWRDNCQRCVTTYEARRRGYDVTALPCYDVMSDTLARGTNYTMPYDRGDRKPTALWQEYGMTITESKWFTKEQALDTVSALMNSYGNGSRAIIDGGWIDERVSHVFIAENVGGKVQFFDPQKPDGENMNCSSYFDRMGLRSLRIFRIDDLPFNENIRDVFINDIEN